MHLQTHHHSEQLHTVSILNLPPAYRSPEADNPGRTMHLKMHLPVRQKL